MDLATSRGVESDVSQNAVFSTFDVELMLDGYSMVCLSAPLMRSAYALNARSALGRVLPLTG
jgi:hypothetical protein